MSFRGNLGGHMPGNLGGSPKAKAFEALKFDSGLGKPQRTIVQDAILLKLQRLGRWNGGYLEAIEPTSTVVRSASDEQGVSLVMDQLKGRAPAILVGVGDKDYTAHGDVDRWAASLTVHLYLLVNSLRSRMARAIGDVTSAADTTADPGSHVVLEHCEQLLIGGHVGARGQIKELRPTSEHMIDSDTSMELWEQRYTVQLVKAVNLNRDLDLELRQINTYHRLAVQADTDAAIVETETDLTP